MKKALITGITGQDGTYLTELLINKNYIIHGIIRNKSNIKKNNYIFKLLNKPNIKLHQCDLKDSRAIEKIIIDECPDEIYNLVGVSVFEKYNSDVINSFEINSIVILRILEIIRNLKLENHIKVFHASTSELFGKIKNYPQNEKTNFYPRSMYGVAKLSSHWMIKHYREEFKIFACNGILFNHESPRRGINFVTRKITKALAEIKYGYRKNPLILGNINAKKDWGHAKDYVRAMWLALQSKKPDDYIISTGEQHTIKEFLELSCKFFEFKIKWEGNNEKRYLINEINGNIIVKLEPSLYRGSESSSIVGDSKKARISLDWEPSYSFYSLVDEMCANDKNLVIKKSNI